MTRRAFLAGFFTSAAGSRQSRPYVTGIRQKALGSSWKTSGSGHVTESSKQQVAPRKNTIADACCLMSASFCLLPVACYLCCLLLVTLSDA